MRVPKAACPLYRAAEQPSLLVGIAALAVAVNPVELVCSAGVPAIYTQMLAMHELSTGACYSYLLLYIVVFLLGDTAIFVNAMPTLRTTFAPARISRVSHPVGATFCSRPVRLWFCGRICRDRWSG